MLNPSRVEIRRIHGRAATHLVERQRLDLHRRSIIAGTCRERAEPGRLRHFTNDDVPGSERGVEILECGRVGHSRKITNSLLFELLEHGAEA